MLSLPNGAFARNVSLTPLLIWGNIATIYNKDDTPIYK